MKIDRFPGYDFHEEGYVVSFSRREPFVLKTIRMGEYKGLSLKRDDGLIERVYLHRVIAEAFHGKCPDGMECRHIDGDKNNNRSSNLAWGTKSENNLDKIDHGTAPIGTKNPMSKIDDNDVIRMREIRNKKGLSYKKISSMFGVSPMTAYRAINKQSWGHIE